MFPAQITSAIVPFKRGPRGFSHGLRGLGDDGPGTIYTLANGHTVFLPIDWNNWTAQQKLDWIYDSNLSSQDAIQLETEAGISSPAWPGPGDTTPAPGGYYPPNASQARPTYDYVRAGDVVRVNVPITSGVYITKSDYLTPISSALPSSMTFISGSGPSLFGNSVSIDVQSRSDRNSISDIASDVWSVAQSAGGLHVTGPPTASFVSKVETTGGNVQIAPLPGTQPGSNSGAGSDYWGSIFGNVGGGISPIGAGALGLSSGVLLAGGAVILVLLLAKK